MVRPEQFREEEDDGAGMPVQTNIYSAAGNLHAVRKVKRQYTEYVYNLAGQPLAVYMGEKKAGTDRSPRALLMIPGEISPGWWMETGTRPDLFKTCHL